METAVNSLHAPWFLFFHLISDSLWIHRVTQCQEVSAVCRLQNSIPKIWQCCGGFSVSLRETWTLGVAANQTWGVTVWPAATDKRLKHHTHQTHHSITNHSSALGKKKSTIFFSVSCAVHIQSGSKHPIYLCVLNYIIYIRSESRQFTSAPSPTALIACVTADLITMCS